MNKRKNIKIINNFKKEINNIKEDNNETKEKSIKIIVNRIIICLENLKFNDFISKIKSLNFDSNIFYSDEYNSINEYDDSKNMLLIILDEIIFKINVYKDNLNWFNIIDYKWVITILISFIGIIFMFGFYVGNLKYDKDKINLHEQNIYLKNKCDSLLYENKKYLNRKK